MEIWGRGKISHEVVDMKKIILGHTSTVSESVVLKTEFQ